MREIDFWREIGPNGPRAQRTYDGGLHEVVRIKAVAPSKLASLHGHGAAGVQVGSAEALAHLIDGERRTLFGLPILNMHRPTIIGQDVRIFSGAY